MEMCLEQAWVWIGFSIHQSVPGRPKHLRNFLDSIEHMHGLYFICSILAKLATNQLSYGIPITRSACIGFG